MGNFMATLKLSILSIFISLCAFAQSDSTLIFEKSKGSWKFPISNFSKIEKYEKCKLCPTACFPIITTNFISDSSVDVKAIHDGTVVLVVIIEDMYVIMTRFGSYSITYAGITNPSVQKGDFVTQGQPIARLQKDYDENFPFQYI